MAKVKVSTFGDNAFRKSVGKHRRKDGTLKPKMWYLGDHPNTAQRRAEFIVSQWKQLKAQGVGHWTDDAIARIESYFQRGDEQTALAAQPIPVPIKQGKKTVRTLTTHQLFDQFGKDYAAGSRARVTVMVVGRAVGSLKAYIPGEPLATVDALKLQSYINVIASLPKSPWTKKHIKPRTAQNLLDILKQVLDYAETSDCWIAPRHFRRLFRAKVKVPYVAKTTFHAHELEALWNRADTTERLYLILMLNGGFTSVDIANLMYDPQRSFTSNPDDYSDGTTYLYVDEDWTDDKLSDWERFGGWKIAGKRTKTNVFGVYPLWVETAKLLSAHVPNKAGRVFGTDLIQYTDDTRIDHIGRCLARLIDRASRAKECRNIPPKVLRKTGAQMIRDIAGLETSQVYLRHVDNTMAGRHYNTASFDKLAEALTKMRSVNLSTMLGG